MKDCLLLLLISLSLLWLTYGQNIKCQKGLFGLVALPRNGRRSDVTYDRSSRATGILKYPRVGRSPESASSNFNNVNEFESNIDYDFDTEPAMGIHVNSEGRKDNSEMLQPFYVISNGRIWQNPPFDNHQIYLQKQYLK